METFYGGKKGAAFVVAKSYTTIEEMVTDFSKGQRCAVKYDEYVLINSANRSDPDNGKLFRRGYDMTNELGGGELIGTIVGPVGPAPDLNLTTIEEAKKAYEEIQEQAGTTIGKETEGSYKPDVELVPGKTTSGNKTVYNDEIKWYSCSFQKENSTEVQAYIGFSIPYLVTEWEAEVVPAKYTEHDFISRTDDGTHPFYHKLKLKIPKGVQGDSVENLRVIPASSSEDTIEQYIGQDDDKTNNREIVVYDWYDYENEERKSVYLGDYNMIKAVALSDEGTLTVKYTHDDDTIFSKRFKWIDSLSLDSTTGKFTVTYNYKQDLNNQSTTYTSNLRWVNGMSIGDDGAVTLTYTTGDDVTLANKLKWVNKITVDADGTMRISYSDGSQSTELAKLVKWIDNISLADNGTFTVTYNNGAAAYQKQIKIPTKLTVADDGTIQVVYNTGDIDTYDKYYKVISKVSLNSTGDLAEPGNQKLKITYNTGASEEIGEPINFIMKMTIREDDFHLLVLYSSPDARGNITYDGVSGWTDMGTIRDYSGLLVGPKIEASAHPTEMATPASTEIYLNTTAAYKDGLTGDDKGKVLTVNDLNGIKQFYAYDYTPSAVGWYHLGNLTNPLQVVATSDENAAAGLAEGGLWFVVEDSIYGV
jgi:hypothetical protein